MRVLSDISEEESERSPDRWLASEAGGDTCAVGDTRATRESRLTTGSSADGAAAGGEADGERTGPLRGWPGGGGPEGGFGDGLTAGAGPISAGSTDGDGTSRLGDKAEAADPGVTTPKEVMSGCVPGGA